MSEDDGWRLEVRRDARRPDDIALMQMHWTLVSDSPVVGLRTSRRSGANVSVPLVSHVDGNLWMGGCVDGVRLPDDFEHVVSLFSRGAYEVGPGTTRTQLRMDDVPEDPDPAVVEAVVDSAVAAAERGKTLVHCEAGLNRSGLVVALVLMRRGRSAREAIELLRERRSSEVLCNLVFERWVLDRPVASRPA